MGGGERKSIASKWLIRGRGESFNRESNSHKQTGVRESKASSEKVVIYKNRQNCLPVMSKLPPPPPQAVMYYINVRWSCRSLVTDRHPEDTSSTCSHRQLADGRDERSDSRGPPDPPRRLVSSPWRVNRCHWSRQRTLQALDETFPSAPGLDHTGPLFSDTQGSNNKQLFALDFQAHKLSDSCRVSGFGKNRSTLMPKSMTKL